MTPKDKDDLKLLGRIVDLCRDHHVKRLKWAGIEIELAPDPMSYAPVLLEDEGEESDDFDSESLREREEQDYFAASQFRPPNLKELRDQGRDGSE